MPDRRLLGEADKGGKDMHSRYPEAQKNRTVQPDGDRKLHREFSSLTNQMRLNATVPFVPPKPKELEIAASIFIGRAWLAQ